MLMGPGAPFEMGDEDVLGATMPVFIKRPRSILAYLANAIETMPDRDYLVFPDRRVTFGGIAAPIAAAAQRLADDYGVGRGDRLAISSANVYDYAVTFWAATSLGAITVAMNGWWTAAESLDGLAVTTPKVIFADDPRADRLEAAGVELGAPLVRFGGPWWDEASEDPAATIPHATIRHAAIAGDEDDPFLILFTSGTTGRAKGAVITHRANIHFLMSHSLTGAATAMLNGTAGANIHHKTLGASPMFHISGMTAQLIMAPLGGMTIVYPPVGRWSEEQHVRMSAEHGITRWSLVPTQAWRIVEFPDLASYDLTALVGLGGGSAVWPPELLRELTNKFPNAVAGLGLGFGMTETCGLGTSLPAALVADHADSVGVPSAGVSVEVRDPDTNQTVPEGEVGEICMRSAANFLEYWDNPQATAAAIDRERWYYTGDFGYIRDGLLYLEGRRSDLIIRGGENIYPAEIENRLVEHPGVFEAAVVGVPHPQLGQEVAAYVTRTPGVAAVSEAELVEFLAASLAKFKVPTSITFVDDFPRNATGKVLKAELLDPSAPARFVSE